MSGKLDQAKGRLKEAIGSLTRNTDLKHEGRNDRLAGEAKEKVGHTTDKAEAVIDNAKNSIQEK